MDELTQLALAAADGDSDALEQFVRATQADVWRLCAHLGDRDRADDLTQETYLRAFRALGGYRAEAGARTWLLSIARRAVADALRTATRRRRLQTTVDEAQPDAGAGWEDLMLDSALRALDSDRRAAFVLTQLLGFSYAETSAICGCPVGTVRSRVARARQTLMETFQDEETG
jgi:RNA polymerase sigma-70 factor, ECF subfamily